MILGGLNALNRITGKKISYRFYLNVIQRLDLVHSVDVGFAKIRYDAQDFRPASRFGSILEKEPDIIAWIDEFLRDDDVFYDVGANVGIFSLYSVLKRKNVRVVAFEPESSNYFLLNKNIFLNRADDKILALNLALNDTDAISVLNLSDFTPGGSAHTFDSNLNSHHQSFAPKFKQAVMGCSLDTLIAKYDLPFPTMVKIDVDGNEHRILEGMRKTLQDPRLRTIVIEAVEGIPTYESNTRLIESAGFKKLTAAKYLNPAYANDGIHNFFFAR